MSDKYAYTNRQLALKLAVQAMGNGAHQTLSVEILAKQFQNYLDYGSMRGQE